ncbi:DUF2207 domain-containing protein [Limosilactobacillus mucosae]|uniref:DUF2207 domain-containing protein n=1 Tax=Limosilactobacillus mucosae TaxID=97478 RepID=A0AAJ1HW98_LIMMU|nr:DUF2207 domain-containing protein [Limosilactobacillus mucosae]MDC2829785.1 DUF2207 domain-containing protein [Limosilactobacillus mucosae]MDC2837241.1 DUF2207 domain-containing protein [Limosilactobacillus mucosae]MDC2849463.1 DUF2207 domain-containing protein [Limosilactobacillus mucosae]MDC2853509.1 DUF2207 domain-containing protein [Limosilactobacillus mucosae]
MKKQLTWLMGVMALMIMILIPIQGLADGDFNIKQYQVNVDVLKNGDADLTQKITYEFDGDFHGVYYNQDLKGIGKADQIAAAVEQNGHLTKLPISQSGQNDTVKTTQTNDWLKLKVYHQISDAEATFIYHYRLHNVITSYQDTAELNWKIIGTGWDEPLHNVSIVIQLPGKNVDSLKAFTHGPLNGKTVVLKKQGRVRMTVDRVSAHQFVESHLLFDNAIVPDSTKHVDKKVLATKLKEEQELAKKANAKREQQKRRVKIIKIGYSTVSILSVLTYGWWFVKKRPPMPKQRSLVHSFEIPPYPVEQAFAIDKNQLPNARVLSGYLMQLAGEYKIEIQKTATDDYRFTVKKPAVLAENSLLSMMFEKCGDGQSFTISQFKKWSKKRQHAKKLAQAFDQWAQDSLEQARQTGYYDENADHFKQLNVFLLIMVALLIFGMIFVVDGLILKIVIGVLFALTLGWGAWYSHRLLPYTPKGQQMKYDLDCFILMLKDIGDFKLKEVGDIILWEQILPYATAFGLAKKVINELRLSFTDAELNDSILISYPWIFASDPWTGTFESTFEKALDLGNSSSTSGGSGGFSAGSSGGFGGGSGGGAF